MCSKRVVIHKVLFSFKDGVTWSDVNALAAEAKTLEHPRHIPCILAWICGRNIAKRSQAVDFSVIGAFADNMQLAAYQDHPDHQRGVELWRRISTWNVSDLLVDRAVLESFFLSLEMKNAWNR